MEKLVYLLWDDGPAADLPARGDALRDDLLGETAGDLLGLGVRRLTVNVHDTEAAAAPSPAPAPDGEPVVNAEVSLWVDSYDKRGPIEGVLGLPGVSDVAGYRVLESLYDDYGTTPHAPARSWPDGERSPGVLTVATIHRPAGLDEDEWIRRWHGTQSPVSGELQPRTRYVRNEVVRAITPGAPEIHGIVEEGWPSAAHVADPMLFFNADGDPRRCNEHIARMMASVEGCLDIDRLRSTTMSEYFVVSEWPR
ncbi:MAG: hypothetical protein M3Z03_03340 [Actinomycetota bacterium]|nr:hypothetical protein [Actinomycetota bacterium]